MLADQTYEGLIERMTAAVLDAEQARDRYEKAEAALRIAEEKARGSTSALYLHFRKRVNTALGREEI